MDNQTSSPQLIFPNVPDDFCPTGNWTEILQAFVDEVLANGTINVPGLGDVTPAEIQTINEEIQSLQNQVEALDTLQIRRGEVTGVGAGDSSHSCNFSTNMTTSDYTVAVTPRISSGGTTTTSPSIYILDGSKSINSFTVIVENNGTTTPLFTSFEWMAIYSE
jgi:hypothetical protein